MSNTDHGLEYDNALVATEMAILLGRMRRLSAALSRADKAATDATAEVANLKGQVQMLEARNRYLADQNYLLELEKAALTKSMAKLKKRVRG